MSFGGGFGSNNSGSTFGGFGNTNTNTTSAGTSLFGGGTSTSGGFGGGGGFGASNNTSNPFGQSKPFGQTATTSSGSMFGSNTSTAGGFGGGGGFGSNNNTSTGFGATNNSTGGGLFGQNKPASTGFGGGGGSLFGSSNTGGGFGQSTTQSNPFGGGATSTNTGFGGSNTTGNTGFGATNTGSSFGFGNNAGAATAAGNNNQGTSATPFNAFTEKEGTGSSTVAYQSITFQQPYQNKSFEELRVEDYMQNRRYPQSGSFGGGSSTFGGFGQQNNTAQSGSSLFGANNNNTASTGFGASGTNTGFGANNSTGFGNSNTGGGLFGQNKPTGGSLFGNTAASSGTTTGGFGATAGSGGSLFGNNNQSTGGGFGGGGSTFGANNNSNTGGSLFGGANQTQNKPAFGGFGAQNNTATTGSTGFGGFGQNNQQGSQQQGGGLFGASNNTTGGGFGQNNTGGSLFGNNQAKPAGGLFGGSTGANNTSTGGLFGNNNNTQQQGGGLFGQSTNNNNNNTGGSLFGSNNQGNTGGSSLFGNNQNKPATGGLFGSSTAGANTGGSLFGNNNQQQGNTGGSLFGGSNQTQQNTGGSLFGNNQNKPAGGSLFGNTGTGNTGSSLFGNNQNNSGGSLFGNNNANQNQGGGSSLFGGNNQAAGSSLFGGSQQNQQQPNTLQATLTGDPYGNAQLFSSLAAPSPPVGPLVTPLSNTKPPPRPRASLLASVRGSNSLVASLGNSPRPTRPGYGFSYSTYNSPVNGSQSLTPGAAGLLRPTGSLNSSLAGRLSKSFSTSNLRSDSPDGQSLLRTPVGAQSPLLLGSGSLGSGSARKLRIDRSVRNDLFGEPPRQKQVEAAKEQDHGMRKRVSFDNSPQESTQSASNALVMREDDEDQTPRATPEAPRVNGSGLSSVPEDSVPQQPSATASPKSRKPLEPGEYYCKPTVRQLKEMSRQERSTVADFTVGRRNIGWIVFGRGKSVDLTKVDIDNICGGIVRLIPRHATVYEDDANKPAMGQGLNVPSTIYLEQSWPRSSRLSGVTPQAGTAAANREVDSHKRRLKKVGGTDFKDYNPETGVWTFTVEHFTTYGLDDDDDEEDMDEDTGMLDLQPKVPSSMRTASSALSDPPATGASLQRSMDEVPNDFDSPDLGEQDDTFEFKLAKRSQQSNMSVPGGFGGGGAEQGDHDGDEYADEMQDEQDASDDQNDASMEDPFIEAGGAVQAMSPGAVEQYHSSMLEDEDVDEVEQGVPGSFRAEPPPPKSILKPAPAPVYASPEKVAELPWEDQLQRTLSPKKRDRQALRDMQASLARAAPEVAAGESPFKKSLFSRSQLGQSYLATKSAKKGTSGLGASTMGGGNNLGKSQAFTTGMDLINSLWGHPQKGAAKTKSALSETSYPTNRPCLADSDMNEQDAQFHETFKPTFDNRDTLVYSVPGSAPHLSDGMGQSIRSLVGEGKDVRFATFKKPADFDSPALDTLSRLTQLHIPEDSDTVPHAVTFEDMYFADFAQLPWDQSPVAGKQEKAIWTLCSILFDPLEACAPQFIEGMSDEQTIEYELRIRVDALVAFWSELVRPVVDTQLTKTKSAEERALLMLTRGDVVAASQTLAEAGDLKLATLVSQLPGNETSRELMKQQIANWKARKDWSEFSAAHKALYSILAGETCTVAGVTGAPEDRAQPFCISERFGLDWKQAFALRLQFGGKESLVDAVHAFVVDLQQGEEKVATRAAHQQGDGEDTLLGLLKLEAQQDSDLMKLLSPADVSGSPLNSRLAWQLAVVLITTQICKLPAEKIDQLTVDFAAQLEAVGDWVKAAWTLLHLTDAESRANSIKALLERNAAHLPAPEQEETVMDDASAWSPTTLQLPSSLIWSAKALYAATVLREPALQAAFLLNSGLRDAFAEAHDVLCRTFGPKAVIEQDYTDLAGLLQHFDEAGAAEYQDWQLGGKIYALYVRLVSLAPGQKHGRDGRNACFMLKRELDHLEQGEQDRGRSLEMKVSMLEMRRVLGETMREIGMEQRYGFEDREEVGRGKPQVEGMLDGYRRALGVVA